MSSAVPAAKMNGLGNAILAADMRGRAESLRPDFVRALARNPKTAFDQLMAVYDYNALNIARPRGDAESSPAAAYDMQIWNADGTEAGACGNGTRCIAEWLYMRGRLGGSGGTHFRFRTKGGEITAERLADGRVTINMGRPDFNPQAIPMRFAPENMSAVPLDALLANAADFADFPQACAVLSVGNPHAVFFARSGARNLRDYPLDRFGPTLERSPAFPQGVNVSLARVTSPADIALRVWERGAGLTRACGTAACAAVIAARRLGLTGAEADIHLPGGDLHIALRGDFCFMTGGTEYEYGGMLNLITGEFTGDERACERDKAES